MGDDDVAEDAADDLDGEVAKRFARLDHVPVPDVWDRVSVDASSNGADLIHRRSPRKRALVGVGIAAGLVAGVLGVFGAVRLLADSSEEVTATVASTGVTDASSPTGSTAATGSSAPTGSSVPPAAGECNVSGLAARLREGVATFDYQPSESPKALADSSVALRGQLIGLRDDDGGSAIQVKVSDIVGADEAVVTTGTELLIFGARGSVTEGLIEGQFVAFVAAGPGGPLPILPEGLWVACTDASVAEAVLALPEAPGWADVLADGVSLDELWEAALFGEAGRRIPLPEAVATGDGAAVFDVRTATGERFRVSVPQALADGLDTLAESDGTGPVVLEGPAGTVSIQFEHCADQDGTVENSLGSAVRIDDGVVRLCRPDELLSTTVESGLDLSAALDVFDVRPIAIGSRYGPVLFGFWRTLAGCGNCAPWGPMVFPDAGVVVNRTGANRITAVDLDDLSRAWTFDTPVGAVHLHSGPDAVYVEISGGDFVRLDPTSGEVVWRIGLDAGERGAGLNSFAAGVSLLRTSFSVEGDDRAPLLRSIDVSTGEIRWRAEGRPGTEWQWTSPVLIDGLLVLMDVTETAAVEVNPVGGSLRAYDASNGELVWTTDLGSPTEAFDAGLLFVLEFEDGRALVARTVDRDVVRIDPATGAVMWRTPVGQAHITGTTTVASGKLAISLGGGFIHALDPTTGEPVPVN